jgi:DNA helicase HerA-like ATPase
MSLKIPNEAFEQHMIVLGKTGAGKSYTLRGLIERLLRNIK